MENSASGQMMPTAIHHKKARGRLMKKKSAKAIRQSKQSIPSLLLGKDIEQSVHKIVRGALTCVQSPERRGAKNYYKNTPS